MTENHVIMKIEILIDLTIVTFQPFLHTVTLTYSTSVLYLHMQTTYHLQSSPQH